MAASIEAYLAKNVEAILLRDSQEEERAFGIYQSLQANAVSTASRSCVRPSPAWAGPSPPTRRPA